MKKLVLGMAVLALVGCGSSEAEPVTSAKLLSALTAGGVEYSNVEYPERNPSGPLPNSYKEHLVLALPSVAPKGGQFFICEKKEYCDALYTYFDALKAFAGPYIYRSKDGLVVAQLNSGLEPPAAEQVQAVVEGL